jgi:hypothetical protein
VISKTFPSGSRKYAQEDVSPPMISVSGSAPAESLLVCPLDVLDREADLAAPPIVLR